MNPNAPHRPRRPGPGDQATPTEPDEELDRAARRAALECSLATLRAEYTHMLRTLHDTVRDNLGGDQADIGTRSFENDQSLHLLNVRQELITQTARALDRIDEGTYGQCERCHRQIAPARLEAFPVASLCIACKLAEEHY